MKKTIGLLSIALLPTIALNASAAGTPFTGAATVGANTCPLLVDDLKLNPSSGVVGAYNCDSGGALETAKGAQFVLATCHTAGRQGSRTSVTTATTGTPPATGTATVSGSLIFRAGTGGGSMAQMFPGGACDASGSKAGSVL